MTDAEWLAWLEAEGFRHGRIRGERWDAVLGLLFTSAIVTGRVGDVTGYDDRWCYRNGPAAEAALDAWDGTGEPEGWHRHPASGRRLAVTGDEIDDRGRRVEKGEIYVYR